MATLLDVARAFRSACVTFKHLTPQRITPEHVFVGNHAVVCRCILSDSGKEVAIKCYPRHRRNIPAIYGASYMRDEACIYTVNRVDTWLDVVVEPWIEGRSLDTLMRGKECDYGALSAAFDHMALALLRSGRTHGDIKPENVIVVSSGDMHLIDYDAAWVHGFTDADLEEVGTPAFSHPLRVGRCFDAYIDDYPIALISIMLAAMSYSRESFEPFLNEDNTIFNANEVFKGTDARMLEAISLFERRHDRVHSSVAHSLYGSDGHVEHLADILAGEWVVEPKIPLVVHE